MKKLFLLLIPALFLAQSVTVSAQTLALTGDADLGASKTITVASGATIGTPTGMQQILRGQNTLNRTVSNSLFRSKNASNAWFQTLGYFGEQSMKDNFAGYKTTGWGFTMGIDKAYGKTLLGVAYGYTGSQLDTEKSGLINDPSTVNVNTHTFIGYALARLGKRVYVAGKLGCTVGAYDGQRIPDIATTADWKTDSQTLLLQTTLGYRLVEDARLSLTPKFKFGYFDYAQAGYRERWSNGSTAQIGTFQNGYCTYEALCDFESQVTSALSVVGCFGYRRLDGAKGAVLNNTIGGIGYLARGVAPAENLLIFDLGCDALLTENLSFTAEYNLQTGDGAQMHGGKGTFVLAF